MATAKQGGLITLMGLVHYGRLISAKKHCLQAAVNSDGCFSAPGTLGGVATGKLPPKKRGKRRSGREKEKKKKKTHSGDWRDRTGTGLTMCLFPHCVSVNLRLLACVYTPFFGSQYVSWDQAPCHLRIAATHSRWPKSPG